MAVLVQTAPLLTPTSDTPTQETAAPKAALPVARAPSEPILAPLASGVAEAIKSLFHKRTPTDFMLDLSALLSSEQLAQVDPRIVAFYKNPTAFDLRAGVDMTFAG